MAAPHAPRRPSCWNSGRGSFGTSASIKNTPANDETLDPYPMSSDSEGRQGDQRCIEPPAYPYIPSEGFVSSPHGHRLTRVFMCRVEPIVFRQSRVTSSFLVDVIWADSGTGTMWAGQKNLPLTGLHRRSHTFLLPSVHFLSSSCALSPSSSSALSVQNVARQVSPPFVRSRLTHVNHEVLIAVGHQRHGAAQQIRPFTAHPE